MRTVPRSTAPTSLMGKTATCAFVVLMVLSNVALVRAQSPYPNFNNIYFEANFTDGTNSVGYMWWDGPALRARADYLDVPDNTQEIGVALCDRTVGQVIGYEIIHEINMNFTLCIKRMDHACNRLSMGNVLGKMAPYLNIINMGVGMSMFPNGTSKDCDFPGTVKCPKWSLYEPGCSVAEKWEWVLAQDAHGVYYPQRFEFRYTMLLPDQTCDVHEEKLVLTPLKLVRPSTHDIEDFIAQLPPGFCKEPGQDPQYDAVLARRHEARLRAQKPLQAAYL